jgi:hypothetical protein
MPSFGAMPFGPGPEGKIVYGAPRRTTSEIGARCLAAAMVATSPGAVVFSYEGEASSRTIANLVIIDQYEAEPAEAAPAIKEAA